MATPVNTSSSPQMSQTSPPVIGTVVTQQPASTTKIRLTVAAPPVNAGGNLPQSQAQPYTHTVPVLAPNGDPTASRWWSRKKAPPRSDPWYIKAAEEYPAGYPSLAAYMSDDIDGRLYRRFSYLRNRLLLNVQDKLNALEQGLEDLDRDDEDRAKAGENEALYRLISRRYNERTAVSPPASAPTQQCACCCMQNVNPVTIQPATPGSANLTGQVQASQVQLPGSPPQQENNAHRRVKLLEDIDETLEKYDGLLLREHEISSIRNSSTRQRASLANFIWNGKECGPGGPKKPLSRDESKLIYRRDDSILLGTQEDAWLGTAAESVKRLIPGPLRIYFLANREDREKSRVSKTEYLTNDRVNNFVKGVVSIACTVLLVLPIIILYALSTNGASGWLKIGILLVFVVAFALALSILTNASRSEMFGGSAGYTAVLIVFLTFTGTS